jgi:membrane associated rhomboid family serine protease
MSPSADLFVVCKQCGSEVSPYITECPYCGNRLRRRAPKLPRGGERWRRAGAAMPSLGRLRRGEIPGIRADPRPYGTIALIVASCACWVAVQGNYINWTKTIIAGRLGGQWWRLISAQFTYLSALYAFAVVFTLALFGWLLERRHGLLVTLVLFFAAGIAGELATLALYPDAVIGGANAGAMALLAAWAAPDLRAARGRSYYEGDLLGTAAIAAVVLGMSAARVEASWLGALSGGVIGLLVGLGLSRGASEV